MDLQEVLKTIKEYLKVSKDLSMLLDGQSSFMKCYNKDTHRLHGRVDTIGAATHRCTHNSPNITQVPKSKEFRELLCVPSNKVLIDVDAGALELVVLGHYLGPYDNHEFAKIVNSGKKEDGTDIHTINQKRVGLPSRDAAKTFIYSVNYGAGVTKIGDSVWDREPFTYSEKEYKEASKLVKKRVVLLDGKEFFPISKDTLTPLTEDLVLATIYGNRVSTAFRDNTKGYRELCDWAVASVVDNHIKALDGRWLYLQSQHKALNLYIQSGGAIYMKYLLVEIDKRLREKFTYEKSFAYVANIHDAINIECNPEIAEEISKILKQTFIDVSYSLGFKYPVYGEPHIGKNQYETH